MWDWAGAIWDAIPTSESIFGTDIWDWGSTTADAPLVGVWDEPSEYTNWPTSYEQADASIAGYTPPDTWTDKLTDKFLDGLFSPQSFAVGAGILGSSYISNAAQDRADARTSEDRAISASEKEKDREFTSEEKQRDREFQQQMMLEKAKIEADAAAAKLEKKAKADRFAAMLRAAENQTAQANTGGQAAARALADLASLSAGPLRR